MDSIQEKELYELYFIVLLCNKYGECEMPYDMDVVWNNISKYYYSEYNLHTDDRDTLFAWLQDKARYELLDALMLQVFNKFVNEEDTLNKTDPFFISNVLEMKNIMSEHGKKIRNKNDKLSEITLSKMDKREVINIVREILLEVDPTQEWLDIYEEAMEQNRIVYINLLNDNDRLLLEEMLGTELTGGDINSCIFLNNKGQGHILLTYTGTINDVVVTTHEIIHYISRYKNNWSEEVPILREFTAIFYELYALEYLRKMDYSEDEINKINQDRLNDMAKLLPNAENVLDYLIMLMEYSKITEENDDNWDKYLKADKCINDLVQNPYLLNDYYPYLLGNYLANNGIKRIKDDTLLLSMIKYMTNNLSQIDAYDVFNILGCGNASLVRIDNELFKDEKAKKKIKQ